MIDLYDQFTHGNISRRDLLDRLAQLAGGAAAALAIVPLLQNNYALAQVVAPSDERLATERAPAIIPSRWPGACGPSLSHDCSTTSTCGKSP
jgi:carboxymethylenebutenolidase